MEHKTGSLIEWLMPLAFIVCAAWLTWHMPVFILDWNPPEGSDFDKLAAQFQRMDVTPDMGGLFGGFADLLDWLALVGLFVFLAGGIVTVRRAAMEIEDFGALDRAAVFLGRVAMMLIILLTSVMLYEVFVRYVLNEGTYWANELSLWLAGFVFLLAGLYAMQQRSHIRIYLIYDMFPRWLQRACDTFSTLLILVFAFALVYGGYGEAFAKFYRWELFGTAFDPPIPATVKPMILLVVCLVAIQSVLNLIADWNDAPTVHSAADDIDEDELRRLREAVGADDKTKAGN